MVDQMMRKKLIPYTRLGRKTVRFDYRKVLAALTKLEIRAIGS